MRVFSLSLVVTVGLASLGFVACGSELDDDPLPTAGQAGKGGAGGKAGTGGSGTMGAGGSGTMGAGGSGMMGGGGSGTMGGGGAGGGAAGQGGGGAGGAAAGAGGSGGAAGQGGGGGKAIGYCTVQFPPKVCSTPGNAPTNIIFGRIYVAGATDASGAPIAEIKGEVLFGAKGTDVSTWTAVASAPNDPGFNFADNNDEHKATLPGQALGDYQYVYRFSYAGGAPLLCDVNGVVPGSTQPGEDFNVNDAGAWTVAATCP